MYARQRNGPGNGFRPNPMGMGNAPRISPEGSMRGHRTYNNPDFRNFNRGGYGRGGHGGRGGGYSKPHIQQPVPPPREPDVFMEAGKLAAEYLVSRGVLPPNALSGKWQNDVLKNLMADLQGFRSRDVANTHIPADRRRLHDEYSSSSTRNFMRGCLRIGSSKNYGSEESSFKSHISEVKREFVKIGSRGERNRVSPASQADSDASVGQEQQHVAKDGNDGLQSLSPGEITQDMGSELVKGDFLGHSLIDAIGEPAKESHDAKEIDAESQAVIGGNNGTDFDQNNEGTNEVNTSKEGFNLVNEDTMKDDKKISKEELPEVSSVYAVDGSFENSADNSSSDQNDGLKSFQAHSLNASAVKEEDDCTLKSMQGHFMRSASFPLEGSLHGNQEPSDEKSGFGRSNSMFVEKVGKRVLDDDTNGREDFKRLREWVPVPSKSTSETRSDDQNISLFPQGQANSCELVEEKQLFPGSSFKTCDLNLLDAIDRRDVKPAPILSSVAESGKEALPIDVDLSMSNNCNPPNRNGKQVVNNDNIEIIDLEDDSVQEDKGFTYSRRGEDTLFSDLDGFHNSLRNANEIPDTQDGYGLMISELLGNHSPNSSSVASGLNSMHNHMDLPSEEGLLGDDDSIYMSLGEIPISLLETWEQPTQDYGKPF